MDYDKKNEVERVISYFLLKNLSIAEKACPGSSFFSFLFFVNFFLMKKEKKQEFENEFKKLINITSDRIPNRNEFEALKAEFFKEKPPWVFQLYNQVNELSGLKGVVSIKPQNVPYLTVEVKKGYRFPISLDEVFFLGSNKIELIDAKICFIDGMIEKQSEIINLLNSAFETKQPLVLVAQKYSDEVLAILATNHQRKVVKVYPLLVEPSIFSLNQIGDMAVTCNSDLISTLSGDSLITKRFDKLQNVNSITITNKEIVILHPESDKNVSAHLRTLLQKKSESNKQYQAIEISDFNKLYDNRIERLLGNITELQVPLNWSEQKRNEFISFFDESLRKLKTYHTHGVASNEIMELLKTKLPLKTHLLNEKELILPIYYGLIYASSLFETISASKRLVTFVNNQ
jgi:hypothetical protein